MPGSSTIARNITEMSEVLKNNAAGCRKNEKCTEWYQSQFVLAASMHLELRQIDKRPNVRVANDALRPGFWIVVSSSSLP